MNNLVSSPTARLAFPERTIAVDKYTFDRCLDCGHWIGVRCGIRPSRAFGTTGCTRRRYHRFAE